MVKEITDEILNGVGKKIKKGYLTGSIERDKVLEYYKKNLKEADSFSTFGWNISELRKKLEETHNPILKHRIEQSIEDFYAKEKISKSQNIVNLEKLENFKQNALGVGLRKVISMMKKISSKSSDVNDQIVFTLLETEFANLSAKKNRNLRRIIYERKSRLLRKLSALLDGSQWRYGISGETGKNAAYIVYAYLPNGEQLSWHCEYEMYGIFPEIDCQWDGKVCMTMEKILNYIGEHYGIGQTSLNACVA